MHDRSLSYRLGTIVAAVLSDVQVARRWALVVMRSCFRPRLVGGQVGIPLLALPRRGGSSIAVQCFLLDGMLPYYLIRADT